MNIKSISEKIKGNPKMIDGTVYSMLIICSLSHFLNDMIQSIIPSIYPIVKDKFNFSFAQIGIITLVFQMTSSILQPFTGLYADKHPRPYALSIGMCFTLIGLLLLAFAENYFLILIAVSIVGLGSSVFHPTASRVAQMASGGKKSLAQSIFQVGGNGGSAIGPLLAAIIILPFGQHTIALFALAALLAAVIMIRLGVWYKARLAYVVNHPQKQPLLNTHLSKKVKYRALFILVMLVFSKYFYTACITSYFTFFLIDKFGVSVQVSQLCLFVFLAAFAIGTVAGGVLGDKFGRKYVIWFSILGCHAFCKLPVEHYLHLFVRVNHCFGIFFHCGIRHRPDARQGGIDCGHLFRTDVWFGRTGVCLFRLVSRQDKHRVHLSSKCLPATARHHCRILAEHTEEKRQIKRLGNAKNIGLAVS